MDPIACIVEMWDMPWDSPEYVERREALRAWYSKGGFHPKAQDVSDAIDKVHGTYPKDNHPIYNPLYKRIKNCLCDKYGCLP